MNTIFSKRMKDVRQIPRGLRLWVDCIFVLAFGLFAVGTHYVVPELWKVVDDGRPLSDFTNFMLAFPWIPYVPAAVSMILLVADIATKQLGILWVIIISVNLLLFTGVTWVWTIGGSSSFWRYSLY